MTSRLVQCVFVTAQFVQVFFSDREELYTVNVFFVRYDFECLYYRSCLMRLFSKVVRPNRRNRSSQHIFWKPLTSLVARRDFFKQSISLQRHGDHA